MRLDGSNKMTLCFAGMGFLPTFWKPRSLLERLAVAEPTECPVALDVSLRVESEAGDPLLPP